MNDLLFGLVPQPEPRPVSSHPAQRLGGRAARFDYISVQDHPYVTEFLDPLVLNGMLIGQTDRIRFMTNVSNLPLRPPARLAKAAASLDVLSAGRSNPASAGPRVGADRRDGRTNLDTTSGHPGAVARSENSSRSHTPSRLAVPRV